MTTGQVDTAREAITAGISVVPACRGGGKNPLPEPPPPDCQHPDCVERRERGEKSWKHWMHARADERDLERWYISGNFASIGVVCGSASTSGPDGQLHLEMFELEGRAVEAGLLERFRDSCDDNGLGDVLQRVTDGWSETTPSGGVHLYYWCEGPLDGSRKLAYSADGPVLAETKGEGGYSICSPTSGDYHRSGNGWERYSGGPATIATITPHERRGLHAVMETFNERTPPAPPAAARPARPTQSPGGGRGSWVSEVIADYNAATTWPEVLAGRFEHRHTRGDVAYWHYIGAENDIGATTNKTGNDTLIVFSGTAAGAGFNVYDGGARTPSYDRFSAFVILTTGRDDQATRVDVAKRLQREGYGPAFDDGSAVANYIASIPDTASVTVTDEPAPVTEGECPDEILERLWTAEDSNPWPVADPAMFYGPLGEFALAASEQSEASAEAIYAHALAMWGTLVGRTPHFIAGNAVHTAALFVLVVGNTAKGRKGTSLQPVKALAARLDDNFARRRIMSGFGSGEALIGVLDPYDRTGAEVKLKPGHDQRLLLIETEFGAHLARTGRDGNTTSGILRNAWDGSPLEHRTVNHNRRVDMYHLGLVGHVTKAELMLRLTDSDIYGGMANRLLVWMVRRHQLLPEGGNVPEQLFDDTAKRLKPSLDNAWHRPGRRNRTPEARELWKELYEVMADDEPAGLLGQVIARDIPQTARISLGLALADNSPNITEDHIQAAYLAWQYSRASAAHLFGEHLGSTKGDKLLQVLRDAGENGHTVNELTKLVWSNHGTQKSRQALLDEVEQRGLIASIKVPTPGRPTVRYWATRPVA